MRWEIDRIEIDQWAMEDDRITIFLSYPQCRMIRVTFMEGESVPPTPLHLFVFMVGVVVNTVSSRLDFLRRKYLLGRKMHEEDLDLLRAFAGPDLDKALRR